MITTALLLALVAVEPQVNDSIRKGTSFSIAADYDDPDAVGIRLYMNGAQQASRTLAELGCSTLPCVVKFPFLGGLQRGTYVFYMEAFNSEGVAASQALTVTVTPGPPKEPTNIRVIKGQ